MAVVTRYHRLSEENTRPSLDSTGEDEHFLDPHDHDNPSTPSKQKQIKYSFHPTIYLRCVSSFLYLSGGIAMLLSHREQAMPASIFVFIAMGRQLWVPLHHLLTGFLRVRIRNLRIEFRKRGSRITTKEPKNKFPTWLLVGFVQMAIDIVLATLVLGFTAPVPYRSWYYGETLGAKIVVFVALNPLSSYSLPCSQAWYFGISLILFNADLSITCRRPIWVEEVDSNLREGLRLIRKMTTRMRLIHQVCLFIVMLRLRVLERLVLRAGRLVLILQQ
ncbi:hypothetical protein WAI453_011809 [Rhynchosporium graminicola]